jgi:hypothetical protein
MPVARYEPNPFFEEEVQTQVQHQEGMHKITKKIAKLVVLMGPHKRFRYEKGVRADGQDVVAGYKSFWHFAEWGARNHPGYAPMRRAFRAAGMKLKIDPKP